MKFTLSTALSALCAISSASAAAVLPRSSANDSSCIKPRPIPDLGPDDLRNFGVVLFDALDMIDVYGPLDPLQIMAKSSQQLNLHLVARTLDGVTTAPGMGNPHNSSFWPRIPSTATFDDADELDLDVLIVPGGPGVRAPDLGPEKAFLEKMFPRVKIFMTICTGGGLAGMTGLVDDYLVTTNKAAWNSTAVWGPGVNWVTPARFMADGKVWSSSGVTSSLDLIFAFISTYWGAAEADRIATLVEHVPRAWNDDPIAGKLGIPPSAAQPCEEDMEV